VPLARQPSWHAQNLEENILNEKSTSPFSQLTIPHAKDCGIADGILSVCLTFVFLHVVAIFVFIVVMLDQLEDFRWYIGL
jgi:hypothetical protein